MRALFILFMLAGLQAPSQSYTVIHVIGKIYDSNSGQYLSKGTKVAENANLKFETSGARAAVLSSSRGRFVIQKNNQSTTQSDSFYALNSVISPARGRLSTRSGAINNAIDFKKYFDEGPVALVGSTYSVEVSAAAYPMSESKFFYAQYQYQGETINKKLGNNNQDLIIDIDGFYSIDGKAIVPSMVQDIKLFFYSVEDQTSSFITNMNLVVVPKEDLKSILEQFAENKVSAVLELVNTLYGKCSEEQLNQAIAEL